VLVSQYPRLLLSNVGCTIIHFVLPEGTLSHLFEAVIAYRLLAFCDSSCEIFASAELALALPGLWRVDLGDGSPHARVPQRFSLVGWRIVVVVMVVDLCGVRFLLLAVCFFLHKYVIQGEEKSITR
jgi:hypothetical protein